MEGGTWRFATVFSAASPSETAMARGVDEAGATSRMGATPVTSAPIRPRESAEGARGVLTERVPQMVLKAR